MSTVSHNGISIGELAERIDRKVNTIRLWDKDGILPIHLRPQRDDRNRRWWTEEQVEQIERWLMQSGRRPGHGIATGPLDDDQMKKYLDGIRRKREGVEQLREEILSLRGEVSRLQTQNESMKKTVKTIILELREAGFEV